eukprot:s369_g14.t1
MVALDSDEEIADEEWAAATQKDDDASDAASRALMHAPTLRLGEMDDDDAMPRTAVDHGHPVPSAETEDTTAMKNEMEQMRLQNLKMAEELAQLRHQKSLSLSSPPTQREIFTPEATPAPSSVNASPGSVPPAPSSATASPGAAEAPAEGDLKTGEEELAEEMDLSHKDMAVIEEFQKQILRIKEQQRSKEEEAEGGWYTEERMQKDLSYSAYFGGIQSPDYPTEKPEQMALMDTRGVQEGEPGKQGALPCGTVGEMKEHMEQFTESVHQKASSVVSWISQLENGPADNSRFLADMRGIIDAFDASFLKLAEAQHALDAGTFPLEKLQEQFAAAKEHAREPCIKIMAAEHTFKLLLAETKKSNGANANKRPRADEPAPPEGSVEKAPKPKRAPKAKAKAAA